MEPTYKVRVCRGPSCGDETHSQRLAAEFHHLLEDRGLSQIEMGWHSCYGRCTKGPNVLVRKVGNEPTRRRFTLATQPLGRGAKATMYSHVITIVDVADIVTEHLEAGRIVRRLMERPSGRMQQPGQSKKDGE